MTTRTPLVRPAARRTALTTLAMLLALIALAAQAASASAAATTTLAKHQVSGQVFEDMNANGRRDAGEPALQGFTVYADLNGNGTRDAGEPSAASGADGGWTLPVELGTTAIRQETPPGWKCSMPAGCAYGVELPKNLPPVEIDGAVHARAADPVGLDFGNWAPASVSGAVYDDANANGVRDDAEGPIGGVWVFADLNGDGTLDPGDPATQTAPDGSYTIAGLKPGSYIVRQLVPDGLSCTAPSGCAHSVSLQSRGAVAGRDYLDAGGQEVLGERITPGRASLSGRSGCVNGAFSVRVRGARIVRVVFVLDGNRIRVLHKPNSGDTFAFGIQPRRLLIGRHLVSAEVTFAPSSRTHSKSMRLSFQRCAVPLKAPAFTG